MKVIIAGSRDGVWKELVSTAVLRSGFTITQVVSGTARGVDRWGEEYAAEHGIDVKQFPADWLTFGKGAGYVRNEDMADYADALIAVWNGESRGTKHMIEQMKERNKPVYIYNVKDLT